MNFKIDGTHAFNSNCATTENFTIVKLLKRLNGIIISEFDLAFHPID